MPLLLLDLDNTLLPRDAAFRAWAQDFLAERRLPPADLDWLVTIDGGGYVPRSTVLSAAQRRYGLDESMEFLLAHYRRGINSHIHCPSRHIDALRAARAAGWTLGIVSNGSTRPQLEKIRRTGLGPLVDGWVISEEAECLKPDPLIFEIAAQRCGVAPTGDWTSHTWMVGDHAPADIAGAELAGLRSVWLHHGRPWAEPGYRPTLKAAGLPEAVGQVLSARNAPGARPGIRTGGPLQRRAAGAAPVGTWDRSGTAAAPSSARPSARIALSAPDGPRAPSAAQSAGGGAPGSSTRSAVRNRSGEVAEPGDRSPAGGARSAAPPKLDHPERPERHDHLERHERPERPARTRFAAPPTQPSSPPAPPVSSVSLMRPGPGLRPAVSAQTVAAAVAR
ncbi:HAD-IA family hydrolase [Kitasatospora sp. NPDC058170]|uniref:HAD-IA family hydrolase n=1 Tax=Kitasatospora sp. NPDC058170 TaxID=3346364 RepID=UPI0036DC45F8